MTLKQLRNVLIFFATLCWLPSSAASFWQDLWQRPDQQAMSLLKNGKSKQAAEKFTDPEWQAIAHYRAGNYNQATTLLVPLDSSRSLYNQGNALAHLGRYEDAITAYEKALKLDADDQDSIFNRDLLKKLLQQQKQQQQTEQQKQYSQNNTQQQPSQEPQKQADKKNLQLKPPQQKSQPEQQNEQQPHQQLGEKEHDEKENEKDQATKHWLNRIPEDPGGLLREKFSRDFQRRHATDAQP